MRGLATALGVLALAACSGPGGGDDIADDGDDGDDGVTPPSGRIFPDEPWFYEDVSGAPVASNSAAIIGSLRAAGGWGNGDVFQIDFSFEVLGADAATPMRTFTPTDDFYSPDCDQMDVPVPLGGNLEGEDGYACT